jgi:Tripartite tricarboxylate transporter TctB family
MSMMPPGGYGANTVTGRCGQRFNQQFIILNKVGGNGLVALADLVKATGSRMLARNPSSYCRSNARRQRAPLHLCIASLRSRTWNTDITSMALVGLIPTIPIFIIAFMRVEGGERWRIVIPMAVVMTLFVYGLFDQLLSIPWPGSLLGEFFPVLKGYLPSV